MTADIPPPKASSVHADDPAALAFLERVVPPDIDPVGGNGEASPSKAELEKHGFRSIRLTDDRTGAVLLLAPDEETGETQYVCVRRKRDRRLQVFVGKLPG